MQRFRNAINYGLRRGERIFSLDMAYVIKGGFWTSTRFFIGFGASIATMVAFGNLLPKENYGTYSYLLSLGASLGFLTLTGMGPAMARVVARGEENLLGYAIKLQLKYNLLAIATIAAAALYYNLKGNTLFAVSLAILAFVIPLEAAYHLYEHALIGQKRFDTLAFLASISAIVSAAATVLVLFFTDSVLVLILIYGLTSLGPTYIFYRWVIRNLPKNPTSTESEKELRRSALHITGAGIIGALAQYIDKIILFQVAGPAALAVYGFATAGPERLKGLMKNWMSITLPKLSERSIAEIHAVFYKRLGLSIIVGLGFAMTYILFAPFLFKLLLPKYLDSILFSQAYALGLIIIPALVYIGNVFYSQNMLRAVYITSTGNQIIRIALVVAFGYMWQTWGLIAGFVLSQVLGAIFCIWIWERENLRLSKASVDNI